MRSIKTIQSLGQMDSSGVGMKGRRPVPGLRMFNDLKPTKKVVDLTLH